MFRISRGLVILAAVSLLMPGCFGPSEVKYPETGATLIGTVSYGKDKVGAALVLAQNASGSASAFVDEQGNFELTNVPLGQVNIAVNTDAGKGQAMGKLMAQSQGKAKGAPRIIDVPKHYSDPTKSGIKTTVAVGENRYDIVIPK
jgi:hypothetical protein